MRKDKLDIGDDKIVALLCLFRSQTKGWNTVRIADTDSVRGKTKTNENNKKNWNALTKQTNDKDSPC